MKKLIPEKVAGHPLILALKNLLTKNMLGFSLVEALIAALVVSIGILGLAKLQGELFMDNSLSRMQTHALNAAQEKIEELRSANYDTLADGQDTITGENADFTRAWTISNCPNGVNCRQVSVTMGWTDSRHGVQQMQLTSYIGELHAADSGMPMAVAQLKTSTSTPEPITTTSEPIIATTTVLATTTTVATGSSTTATQATTTAAAQVTTTTANPITTTAAGPSTTTTTTIPPIPKPVIDDGVLIVPQAATYAFQTLGGAFSCDGGKTYATIITRYKVDGKYVSQSNNGTISFVANTSTKTNFAANSTINVPLLSGQKVIVESVITKNGSCGITTQSAADNENYVKALFNGDAIPGYAPMAGQPTIKAILGPYASADGKTISIQSNQIIYLFEHYNSTSGSTYDLQDNAVLITIH